MQNIFDETIKKNELSRAWLWLGIYALAASGLLSLILVFARAPLLSNLLPNILPFKTALIVHVDLSVVVWLLSITASIWCHFIKDSLKFYSNVFAYLAWAGVILISLSPFVPNSEPISNNYIPILHNFIFILGLSCFLAAIFCVCIIAFISYIFNYLAHPDDYNIVSTSCFIMIIASFCFVMSYQGLSIHSRQLLHDKHYYYEMLFWGGGHILQFLYTQVLGFIWIMLSYRVFIPKRNLKGLYSFYFIINAFFVVPALLIFWFAHVDDPIYTQFFTLHMKYLGGVMPCLVALTLLFEFFTSRKSEIVHNRALISSMVVFFFGGFIGILISGVNVVIPAHYHGSIVGISLALMGYSYYFLDNAYNVDSSPRLRKLENMQPIIYAVGQTLHIIGLWIAGGYGAMRKTPGVELAAKAKFGMAIMGIGGIAAIIGGLMFVIICVKKVGFKGLRFRAKEF
jgi:Cytochrome C and Quinol oxidase polypeptide I